MPMTLKLISYDGLYERLQSDKILINHIDVFNKENKEMLDSIMMKNYSEDNISVVPSCQCGDLKGTYYVNDTCSICNTRVANSVDDCLSFLLWVQKPQEVERFISPMLLKILSLRYTITKPSVNLIEYIMLPLYKIDRKQQKTNLHQLEKLNHLLSQAGIKRGYNSFVENFFKIVEILETEFLGKKPSDEFLAFIRDNLGGTFSNYLPFPNKVLFSSETNELGRFIDKTLISPINVIRRLTGIDLHTRPSAVKQAKVAKSLIELADFYETYLEKPVFKKYGLVRQQLTSCRSHFTARAVIVSIPGIHAHDELHIPWAVAGSLLRPFVLNRLYKRGYTWRQAVNFLVYHLRIYHPVLEEVFNEILADSPGGIAALFSRNPVLHRGSIQAIRITKIKTDPNDTTFAMSDRIGPSFNSDHDGKLVAVSKPF